jgi:hypothetical protein
MQLLASEIFWSKKKFDAKMLKNWYEKNVRYLIIRHALVDKSLLPVVCKQFITKLFSQLSKFCEGKNTVVY